MVVNTWQALCAYVYVVGAALSVVLLFTGADLLLIFFVLTVGAVFLVMATAARSPAVPPSRIKAWGGAAAKASSSERILAWRSGTEKAARLGIRIRR